MENVVRGLYGQSIFCAIPIARLQKIINPLFFFDFFLINKFRYDGMVGEL
jgi:hypothetical protein